MKDFDTFPATIIFVGLGEEHTSAKKLVGVKANIKYDWDESSDEHRYKILVDMEDQELEGKPLSPHRHIQSFNENEIRDWDIFQIGHRTIYFNNNNQSLWIKTHAGNYDSKYGDGANLNGIRLLKILQLLPNGESL